MASPSDTDNYLVGIVTARTPAFRYDLASVGALEPHVHAWANGHQYELQLSGSRAKGTAIVGSTDLDVFISLDPSVGEYNTLENVYSTLRNRLAMAGYVPREQNVSLGIEHLGLKVDVVPGVLHDRRSSDHSLYKRKAQSWTKTNIQTHISHVSGSGRTFDIRAIKIWRQLWKLEFPSFYLELSVLEALRGRSTDAPSANFCTVLEYLSSSFLTRAITDPANTNNCVSDELTAVEKNAIAKAAATALTLKWHQVMW